MTPRTLESLAHALGAATTLDAALVALGEYVADVDRGASLAFFRVDARRGMIIERREPAAAGVKVATVEMSVEQFPKPTVLAITAGGAFCDVGDEAPTFARMLGFALDPAGGRLSLRGCRVDGELVGLLAIREPVRVFGTTATEKVGPMAALFDLAVQRFVERDARTEAMRKLEEITQRLHAEYLGRLEALEAQLREVRAATPARTQSEDALDAEKRAARLAEEQRRGARRLAALEQQLTASIGQLEQAHVELHRRSESLRQRTRSLYLIDRLLTLAATTQSPERLADGLLALVGDDMQALRCSLFLTVPGDPDSLYLAAFRGLAPHIVRGSRIRIGEGVAGRVAAGREPLLVVDAADAAAAPLLGDEYLTTGSFISFPLVVHGALIGVVNLTNRAQRGLFVEEDVERVRMLGLVIALVADHASLANRLIGTIGAG
ncbi:MAG TPA: GAF domain-containing protein [Gemmatimonadaceae bacterium]|nr:GAF domain-containing protein [Gemmatimonadaceae bacterium]